MVCALRFFPRSNCCFIVLMKPSSSWRRTFASTGESRVGAERTISSRNERVSLLLSPNRTGYFRIIRLSLIVIVCDPRTAWFAHDRFRRAIVHWLSHLSTVATGFDVVQIKVHGTATPLTL